MFIEQDIFFHINPVGNLKKTLSRHQLTSLLSAMFLNEENILKLEVNSDRQDN
jgi:hypothetical protein